MGTVIAVSLDGIQTLVDSDTPTVPLTYTYGTAPAGTVLYFHNAWLAEKGPVLGGITDAGSGVVVSTSERASFHAHTNKAVIDQLTSPTAGQLQYVLTATATDTLAWQPTQVNHTHSNLATLDAITAAGSGVIISAGERAAIGTNTTLGTHANRAVLDLITAAGSGVVISAAERTAISDNTTLATHANRAVIDAITDAGSGVIISASERALIGTNTTLGTHTNRTALDTIPSPSAGQAGFSLVGAAGGGGYTLADVSAGAGGTTYRGGLAGNADLTTNSTGNAYLDGDTSMSNGDLFICTSNGTLTTNTGTNIAVASGEHILINTDTTDGTIVDAEIDVTIESAPGVLSVDFGNGVLSGVVGPLDSDDISEGSTNLFLTAAERVDVATIGTMSLAISDNTTLGTHANRAVIDAITAAGSGVVISGAERAAIGTNTTLGTHANRAVLDVITDAGSGIIISAAERTAISDNTTLGTHSNRGVIDAITDAGSGIIISAAERTAISDNETAIGQRLLTTTWNNAAASSISDAGSGVVISSAERASIATWEGSEAINITNAGSNLVITTAERAGLVVARTPGAGNTGKYYKATGEGADEVEWATIPAASGTVTSVNTIAPDGGGDVTLTADNIAPTATRVWVSSAILNDISTALAVSAANQSLLARNGTRQTLGSSGTLAWDADLGVKAMTTLTGNATLPLVTNGTAADSLRLIVTQDAIGGRTLDTSAYLRPGGSLELSTAGNAVDILSVEWVSNTVQYLVKVPNLS